MVRASPAVFEIVKGSSVLIASLRAQIAKRYLVFVNVRRIVGGCSYFFEHFQQNFFLCVMKSNLLKWDNLVS